MATVVLAWPYDDGSGTYQTDGSGNLVPFVVAGWTDVASAPVTIYEDTTGAVLASTTAASSVYGGGGAYTNWYAWSVTITSWSAAPGAVLGATTAASSAGETTQRATLAATAATGTTSAGTTVLDSREPWVVLGDLRISSAAGVNLAGSLAVPAATERTTSAGETTQRATLAVAAASGTSSAAETLLVGSDSTAPSVGTLTVPDSGPSITGISASATDAVGVTKWKIVEKASDSGWSNPAIDGTWTTVASTTSFSSSALTFTSSASSTGTRYFRVYFADAAGNIGSSATDSATITVTNYLDNPGFEIAISYTAASLTNWFSHDGEVADRITALDALPPHDGTRLGSTGAAGILEQLISGSEYRSATGTFRAWMACNVAVASNSTSDGAYLTIIARDSGGTTLGRVDIWVVGKGDYASGAAESIAQTTGISANTWTEKTIDVRTSLDAAIGGGNLANVDNVRILLRVSTGNAFGWDDLSFT